MRYALALLFFSGAFAVEVPCWVKNGILRVESRSYFNDFGLQYVDRRRGADGERGPFQMGLAAWTDIKEPGERFSDLSTNMEYAEECFYRYITMLYLRARSWEKAVQWYNAGPHHGSPKYLNAVKKAGALCLRS